LNISILGSGFGIYGYLPAACSLGWEVTTLTRYREKIFSRKELSHYFHSVKFVNSEAELFDLEFPLVFARTPELQYQFLANNLIHKAKLSHLFLEKPLTNSISNSEFVLDLLRNSRKSFSIGYLFQYTQWFMDLSNLVTKPGRELIFNWRIPITNSEWKNSQASGGGVSSFFLVHFVPLLTKLGFRISDLETTSMNGKFTLKSVGHNYLEINAEIVKRDFRFELLVDKMPKPLFQAQTPFGMKPLGGNPDPRIDSLKRYLKSTLDGSLLMDSAVETELDVIEFLKLCYQAGVN
jgi:hypothetical protein